MYEPPQDTLSVAFTYCALLADVGAAPVARRPAVQMPDEYLPPNKILFLQNLPESVTKDQLDALFSQYPNLHEVRLVPSKKDIAFVEYLDEGSATVAKDALHNHKLDGENKIKARQCTHPFLPLILFLFPRLPLPENKTTWCCLATDSGSPPWVFMPILCTLQGRELFVLCITSICCANHSLLCVRWRWNWNSPQ